MKAYVIRRFGDNSVLELAEVETPMPAAGEVVVAIKAIGLNPVDYIMRQGYLFADTVQFPAVLGCDIAGVVTAISKEVTQFNIGDRVAGLINFPKANGERGGAYAEYVNVPVTELSLVPKNVTFQTAAALPAVGLTAWQAMIDASQVRAGQRVLVHGAAGGVGHIALQLAKQEGATVIATASSARTSLLLALGADQAIDYKTRFEEQVSDIDVVLNPIGQSIAERSLSVIKPGGRLISLVPNDQTFDAQAKAKGIEARWIGVRAEQARLDELMQRVAEGRLTVTIGAVYQFSELPAGLAALEAGGPPGKIVVEL